MWQVVTAPQNLQNDALADEVSEAELDELIQSLTEFTPSLSASPQRRAAAQVLRPAVSSATRLSESPSLRSPNPAPADGEIISRWAIPRVTNAPTPLPLAPAQREQLLKLRTAILLAVEQRQLRSVLVCGADAAEDAAAIAAPLSQLLAEYERLKVAYVEVSDGAPDARLSPFGYTFQIRRTKLPNRYEIASSLGAIRLEDWLRWWSPTVVLQEMKKFFDLVLISAPAITVHSDVALLAGAVDGVLLSATENVTPFASVREAQRRLHAAQAPLLGVTLNQAPPAASAFAAAKARVRALLETVVKTHE